MRALALIAALWCSQALAQFGHFAPKAYGAVQVVMHDTQLPSLQCGARMHPIGAALGLAGMIMGCQYDENGTKHVVVALSPGPWWAWQAQAFMTPNMVLGHEMRHVFEGDYHGVIPFLDRK